MLRAGLLTLALAFPLGAQAQDQTLADIRQELSILLIEVQNLRRELSTTGRTGLVICNFGCANWNLAVILARWATRPHWGDRRPLLPRLLRRLAVRELN